MIIRKIVIALFFCFCIPFLSAEEKKIIDAIGREKSIPDEINRLICSGAGALRLVTYMQAEELVTGVDDIEKRDNAFDARAYALANPRYKKLPLIGEFRGFDNPELILKLNPLPDIIIKIYSVSGPDASWLEKKTGIPVIVLKYGDLSFFKEDLFDSLKILGKVLNKEKRAEKIITYITTTMKDLDERTTGIAEAKKPSCFVGGVAHAGSHGFNSTEPAYSPLIMINAKNVAFDKSKNPKELTHAYLAKEKIMEWDPDKIFIDLATLQIPGKGNGLYELMTDPVYKELTAVKKGNVYGLLPYNWYAANFDSVLANAYFTGKLLFPEKFSDIDPVQKADEIYTFFVGKPIYNEIDKTFNSLCFKKIPLE